MQESVGIDLAGDALAAPFFTVSANPQQARRPRHFVTAEQLAAGGIVGGDVQAEQAHIAQGFKHFGFAKHLLLHDLARHAPVGVVIQQHPLALSLRHIELPLQRNRVLDRSEGVVASGHGSDGGIGGAEDL
ncbi:hypothetical protein D3C73_1056960 [compost metagenome]